MIIRAAVTGSDFKNIAKNRLQFLAMPISTTSNAMAWKIFPDTMQLLKITLQKIYELDQN